MSSSAAVLALDALSPRARVRKVTARPERADAQALFNQNLDLADIMARQYLREAGRADLDLLLSFAREGLFDAACRFDSAAGVPFRGYANIRVRGAIVDGVRQESELSRRTTERLRTEDGVEAVAAAVFSAQVDGLLGQAATDDDGELTLVSVGVDPETLLIEAQERQLARKSVGGLDERASELVGRHYFDGARFDHVAAELGISKSWASRIHSGAMTTLRKRVASEERQMSGAIAAIPVQEITSGEQLFRCVPYSCTMLARACVTRQAQADSEFPPMSLLLCKGCALGREVKSRAGSVAIDPHAAARASRKHIAGLPQKPHRTLTVIATLPAPARPPVLAAPPAVEPPKNEGTMPDLIDLTGKSIGGCAVLKRAPSIGSVTFWCVKHQPCGHEEDVSASALAYCEKNGSTRRCKECGPKSAPAAPRVKSPQTVGSSAAPVARKPSARAQPPSPAFTASSPSSVTHDFPLRRDFSARVELPSDLAKSDVQRLSRWLEALVFEE